MTVRMDRRNWLHKFDWTAPEIDPIADAEMRINIVIFWKLFYVGHISIVVRFVHSAAHFVGTAWRVVMCHTFRLDSLDFSIKIIIATSISSALNMIESHSSDRNIQYTRRFIYIFSSLLFVCLLGGGDQRFRFCIYCASVPGQTIVEILFFNVFISLVQGKRWCSGCASHPLRRVIATS